jgi:hypothetical protein
MSNRILAIDHLMIHVADSQNAGAIFERLGFIATPKSGMPGLSNRLICFGGTPHDRGVCNYIELMALEDPSTAPPLMPELLKNLGPVSTVLAVEDAHAAANRLVEEGLTIGPVLDLQRDWELPDGDVITPAFAVAIPALSQAPIYWNYCMHKTAHHYVRPEFTSHPNGVESFDEVCAVVVDHAAAVAHYTKHWQARLDGPVLRLPEGPALRLFTEDSIRDSELGELVDPGQPGVKALRMRTSDIAAARNLINAQGVATTSVKDGFAINAKDAAGCALVFT